MVEGASILIADIYDRPLHVIFERINACRSDAEADSPPWAEPAPAFPALAQRPPSTTSGPIGTVGQSGTRGQVVPGGTYARAATK